MDEQTITDVMNQAVTIYQTHLLEVEAQAANERAQRESEHQQEIKNLLDWMRTWMPEPLVEFVDLTYFDAYSAGRARSDDSSRGMTLYLRIPTSTPIRFRVYRNYGGDLRFGRWPYGKGNENIFMVPMFARVDAEEGEGDGPFINYEWPALPQFDDIMTAVGCARALYDEWWPALQERWLDMNAQRQESVEEPVLVVEPDWNERVVAALEEIASALLVQANHLVMYG